MAKWHGKIGYTITKEIEPGIWDDSTVIEREYFGDITSDHWKRQNSGEVIDNINLANVISIVADPFAYKNASYMAYVEIMGSKWKISDVEVQRPRLILTVGGVYK